MDTLCCINWPPRVVTTSHDFWFCNNSMVLKAEAEKDQITKLNFVAKKFTPLIHSPYK